MRGTPPVTCRADAHAHDSTPTPGPTSRDVILMVAVPFGNDVGGSASDLHVHLGFPYSGRTFKSNLGRMFLSRRSSRRTLIGHVRPDVDWGVACGMRASSLTLEFTPHACGDVLCKHAAAVLLYVDALRPAGVPGAGRLHAADANTDAHPHTDAAPTPTATPPGQTRQQHRRLRLRHPLMCTVWSFHDTGQTASDPTRATAGFSARLVENAPVARSFARPWGLTTAFDLDWAFRVSIRESVKVEITSESPAASRCSHRTPFGEPLTSPRVATAARGRRTLTAMAAWTRSSSEEPPLSPPAFPQPLAEL